jgi:hypothetical protein
MSLAAVVISAAHGSAVADDSIWRLALEAGSEFDTNIHRLEVVECDPNDPSCTEPEIVSAPVARTGARLTASWKRPNRQRFRLAGSALAKTFVDEDVSEDVLVLSADGAYDWGIKSRGAVFGVHASYYDTIPYELLDATNVSASSRDFRTGIANARLAVSGPDNHRVIASAGYRVFEYKPDALHDWGGGQYGLRYKTVMWRGDPDVDLDAAYIDLNVGYRVERRGYGVPAIRNTCPEGVVAADCLGLARADRTDLNHSVAAELVYTSDRIYSGRYELQVNDSNSYGESLVRQRVELGFTSELPADLFLTAKATIQYLTFGDGLRLSGEDPGTLSFTIDDENRNSLTFHLTRDVTESWAIEGRYAAFTNELSSSLLGYRRQLFYLGLVYADGS